MGVTTTNSLRSYHFPECRRCTNCGFVADAEKRQSLGDSMLAVSCSRVFHVRFVFVGRVYSHFGFSYRHKITGEADADKNRPERFFWHVCPNDRFPKLEFCGTLFYNPAQKAAASLPVNWLPLLRPTHCRHTRTRNRPGKNCLNCETPWPRVDQR